MAVTSDVRVLSAQYQRNGVTGRDFHAAIVSDPFGDGDPADYLVISLSRKVGDTPSRSETFVVAMSDLRAGKLEGKWRGDEVTPETLQAMRADVYAEQIFNGLMR